MRTFVFLLVATLCVYSATAQVDIECEPDICSRVRCAAADCAANQRFVLHGGFCGCCDACITELDEGDTCATIQLSGTPPASECRAPLMCVSGFCAQS